MPLRRASRIVLVAALISAPAVSACGQSKPPPRSQGPPGKIEALREAQEREQKQIEAEGHQSARRVQREREAMRVEAEHERDEGIGDGP
jgi:hypothetical protein